MKKKIAKSIQLDISEVIERKFLVEFNRKPVDKDSIFGFILAANPEFVLIQEFDDSVYTLDGFIVLRWTDVKNYRVYDEIQYYLAEVVKVKNIVPNETPTISLENWESILKSANESFPLVNIQQERIEKGICYIGIVEKYGKKNFKLNEIDPSANWERKEKYKYEDLTRIGFGGRYESTLWEVSESRKMK